MILPRASTHSNPAQRNTQGESAKMDEQIDMLFAVWTRVGLLNEALNGARSSSGKGTVGTYLAMSRPVSSPHTQHNQHYFQMGSNNVASGYHYHSRLLFTVATCYTLCLKKKQDTKLLPITSPNVNRFSKIFSLVDSLVNLQLTHI